MEPRSKIDETSESHDSNEVKWKKLKKGGKYNYYMAKDKRSCSIESIYVPKICQNVDIPNVLSV